MLKRISSSDLTVGMFLHELCGSWMDHPFWRSKFLIEDPKHVQAVLKSGIQEVWIDTSRGKDVKAGTVAPSPEEVAEEVERELEFAASAPMPLLDLPVSRDAELDQARKLVNRSREAVASMFNEVRLGRAVSVAQGRAVVEEISNSVLRSPGTLVSLARLKSQDQYTYMHSVAVCALMVSLSRNLGHSESDVREAGLAGLMHDLGKAMMPLEILNKTGKLTDEEFTVIRTHPVRGHALLVEGGAATPATLDVCLHHHEKVDGTGYPHALTGAQISLMARMGAVCDVYDAVTSNRPYKAGWDPAESLRRMAQWKGHFDPVVFQAFVKSVGIYPTGSLVKLQSGRLAVVTEQNPTALLKPKVKVFFSTKSNLRIVPEELNLDGPWCQDKIIGCESPEDWKFKDLDRLWAGDAAKV